MSSRSHGAQNTGACGLGADDAEPGPRGCPDGATAAVWERLFAEDVRALAAEILVHICGDSCFKYSGAKVERICRHGFYYIISLADWRRRRRGKALRNAFFVVKQKTFGMQGRLLLFQEHPFECPSNYAGSAAMRCNLDVQDLRRVLPEDCWLRDDEELPHLGGRPDFGYMNTYEWDGETYVPRRGPAKGPLPANSLR